MTRIIATLRLVLWMGLLACVLMGAHRVEPVLPLPAGSVDWVPVESGAIVTFGFRLLRLAVLALGWYLLGTTVLCTLVRLGGWARAAAYVDRWSLTPVRSLVSGAVGLSVAITAIAGPVGPALAAESPVTMRLLTDEGGGSGRDDEADVVMRQIEPDSPGHAAPAPAPAPAPASPNPHGEWTVEHGDHLWSIASRVLERTWGRAPSDREVDPYWRRLVDRNRPHLVDVDLLFPGDRIEIPEPPAVP